MRRIIVALLFCWLVAPAQAQLTQAQIDTIINADVLSCGTGCVTADVLRFVLEQMNQSTFQAQGLSPALGCGNANPTCIVPTAPPGTSNTQAASTAFVNDPTNGIFSQPHTWTALQTFNGGALVLTRPPGDNTTNVASTAFVQTAVSARLPYVANIAALNALTATATLAVETTGYSAANDGGGAAYVGSASACSKNAGAGDGVSQIQGATSTCWLLQDPGDISVKVAGAKCDGSTDDAARIQAALDRIGAGTSTTIPISTSGCAIKSTLKLNWSSSRLHGLGSGSLIVGGQGSTDPAFLLIDIIATADHSKIDNLRYDAKIVSTNVNPTMCALSIVPGNFPIYGQGIFIEADYSSVSDIWAANTYDNGIGIGRVNCSTGSQTNGSPQYVNISRIACTTVGHGSHTTTTVFGGGCVDNLTGGANVSDITDSQSASCAILDFGGGANGSFNNIFCNSPQVDGSGANGNCLYAGSINANFSNVYCLLATGAEAVFVDAFASGVQFNNITIAAPAKTGVLIKSATGAGLSPDRIKFTNLNLTDVSFMNSNVGSAFLVDTTAGGAVTNLIVDMSVTDPVGTAYNAYGFARSGSGGLTGSGRFFIGSGLSGTYLSIPVTFKVEDLTSISGAPTVTSCGSGASLASGNQRSGLINVGSTNPTTACTLNFNFFAWADPAQCVFSMFGAVTPVALGITSRTWSNPTALVIISAATDIHSQQISYACN